MVVAVPIPYLQPPAIIVNEALDRLGQSDKVIGDVTDGSKVAEAARRNYGQVLRQMHRASHWNFARKRSELTLLGDATGNSEPPVSSVVECPWTYAYAWPIDAVQGRWLPWNPTNAQPISSTGVPLTTGVSAAGLYWSQPGRFLISSSLEYPVEVGNVPWDQQPDLQRTFGVGPINRQIILTDCCNAHFVYTRFVTVIEEWDPMFREAMVVAMALVLAPVAIDDPKERLAQRNLLIPILKNTLAEARLASGNEAGWPQSTDAATFWIVGRNGPYAGGGLGGYPVTGGTVGLYLPWDQFSLGGNVF
jgi:hypothetical protein